jgi:hypothetical protein
MLKNIGTDRDYILSLESGRVRVRAVSQKARAEIDTFRHEVHLSGVSIDNYALENFISCYSQLDYPIDVLAAIKGELESRGCTVALPKYEAARSVLSGGIMDAEDLKDCLSGDYREYSGRSMYGKSCPGFEYESENAAIVDMMSAIADEDDHDDRETMRSVLSKYQIDSLGLGVILYFPKLAIKSSPIGLTGGKS